MKIENFKILRKAISDDPHFFVDNIPLCDIDGNVTPFVNPDPDVFGAGLSDHGDYYKEKMVIRKSLETFLEISCADSFEIVMGYKAEWARYLDDPTQSELLFLIDHWIEKGTGITWEEVFASTREELASQIMKNKLYKVKKMLREIKVSPSDETERTECLKELSEIISVSGELRTTLCDLGNDAHEEKMVDEAIDMYIKSWDNFVDGMHIARFPLFITVKSRQVYVAKTIEHLREIFLTILKQRNLKKSYRKNGNGSREEQIYRQIFYAGFSKLNRGKIAYGFIVDTKNPTFEIRDRLGFEL